MIGATRVFFSASAFSRISLISNMLTDLNSFLNFDVKHNESYGLVGICEQCAESSFLFHHFVSFLLKRSSVCLISFTQSFNHFNTVGSKIGCSLTAAAKDKQFSFIDGLKALGSVISTAPNSADIKHGNDSLIRGDGKLNIQQLLHFIIGSLETLKEDSGKVPCLIVDNMSVLIDLGCPVKDVIFFVHYLRSFCLSSQGSSMMILGVNNDLGDEDEEKSELWKYIEHCSVISLAVSGLDTGYCKEVHGQMTARWQSATSREKSKEKTTQFKLTDKTCALFASGMSSAVL